MYLLENPVLQRELLVNLRMKRGFVLLFFYVAMLGAVVYVAWPTSQRLDLTTSPFEAKRLVNLFFLGQYVLLALMAPSFAAGTITGEKERRTYEMLLASPLRPGAIVTGKLLASLSHLAVLVFASLPIVMLCLPLGGVSPYEVLATYVAMAASVVTFGMICMAASSYFTRTIAALVVSYLIILPVVLVGVLFYRLFEEAAEFRLVVLSFVVPAGCAVVCGVLFVAVTRRLLHPPDVGAEAKEVVDADLEQRKAVGMVIRSEQFPDKLFAPAKRSDMMADGLNPVYDKEMRSELFGQGTLMLRLVIQLSMFLALPLMAACMYMAPQTMPWYASYVVLFNMLVGPVFSAGTVTSERERETLELLLCTTLVAVADPGGQAVLGAANFAGADELSGLAAAVGDPAAAVDLLGRHDHDGGLRGDHRAEQPHDDRAGDFLFGDLPQDVGEHDDRVSGDPAVVCRAAGGGLVCPAAVSRVAGDGRNRPVDVHQPLCGGVQPAAGLSARQPDIRAPPRCRPSPPTGRSFAVTWRCTWSSTRRCWARYYGCSTSGGG